MPEYMGNINCSCGQSYHMMSVTEEVECIYCGMMHKLPKITNEEPIQPNDEISEPTVQE